MTLNNRQINLINMLDHSTFLKGTIIAQRLHISTRTLRNDVSHINSIYQSVYIESNKYKGYRINPNIELLNLKYTILSPNERLIKITYDLIKHHQLDLISMQKLFFLSDRTLDLDIFRLRKYIYNYNPNIELRRSKQTLTISNLENHQLLHYLCSILFDEFPHNILSDLFENINYSKLYNIISNNLFKHNLHPRYFSISMLTIECAFALEEYNQEHIPNKKVTNQFDISNFLIDVFNEIDLKIDLNKLNNLEQYMLPYLQINEIEKQPIDYSIFNNLKSEIENDILEINRYYSIHLNVNDTTLESFTKHIYFSIFRSKLGIIRENCLTKYLESEYIFLLDLAIIELSRLNSRLDYSLHRTEIMYLCAYFALLYHNSLNKPYFEINIYAPESNANASLISLKLEEQFNHTFIKYEVFQENNLPDLLISTESIEFNIPTLRIKKNPELMDYINISSTIRDIAYENIGKSLTSRFESLLLGIFESNETLNSYQDIIYHHCNYLLENNYVEEGFYNELLSRESFASTTLSTGISFPHSIYRNQKKSSLSIIKITQKIEWDEIRVKLIFLFTFNSDDYCHLDHLLISTLIRISKNKDSINQLIKSDSLVEILKNLIYDSIFPID